MYLGGLVPASIPGLFGCASTFKKPRKITAQMVLGAPFLAQAMVFVNNVKALSRPEENR
jgi:hypothetical protein